jgi:hypothetical protein
LDSVALFNWLYILLGIFLLAIYIIRAAIKRSKIKRWPSTIGEVIDIKEEMSRIGMTEQGKRSRIYAPIVQFIANNRTVVGDDGIFLQAVFFLIKLVIK